MPFQNTLVLSQERMGILNLVDHSLKLQEDALKKKINFKKLIRDLRVQGSTANKPLLMLHDQVSSGDMDKRRC